MPRRVVEDRIAHSHIIRPDISSLAFRAGLAGFETGPLDCDRSHTRRVSVEPDNWQSCDTASFRDEHHLCRKDSGKATSVS